MKVFISWSGELSHKIALEFRDWLPLVIQSVEPYVSSEDIDKGTRWSVDIAKELEDSAFGLICVTPSNLNSPWINFEAGALSKAFEKSKVSPFLFGLKNSDLKKSPLLQFQSTLYNEKEIYKLIQTINNSLESNKLVEDKLKKIFEVWFEKLKEKLDLLIPKIDSEKIVIEESNEEQTTNASINNEILEEVLTIIRSQQKLLRTPDKLLPEEYLDSIFRKYNPRKIPSRHRAWKDLRNQYNYLLEYTKGLNESDELVTIVRSLERPISYLLEKFSDERNLGRRNLFN